MAMMARSTRSKGKCKCFLFPRDEGIESDKLCFRKNFIGALNDEQIDKYCDMQVSTVFPASSEEVQSIVRTIKEFSNASSIAKTKYWGQEDFHKDMDVWRDKVSEAYAGPHVPIEPVGRPVTPDEYEPIDIHNVSPYVHTEPHVEDEWL